MSIFRQNRTDGFTLVEVMIAMFILGVGLLGSAMVQINNTRQVHNSLMRSQSSLLVVEIVERMNINYDEAVGGSYDIAIDDAIPTVSEDCGLTTSVCSSSDLATYDLNQWLNRVASVLPEGKASLLADSSKSPPEMSIIIERTEDLSTESQSFLLSLR